MDIKNKLTPMMADSDLGPNTVLYLKGFSGRAEIEWFMDELLKTGITFPSKDKTQ